MIRIFIVDDHPLVIEGMGVMLTQLHDVEVCGHAMSAASCLGYFVKNTADIVLLDISLPDESGIEVCKILLKKIPHLKVIALTNFDQLVYVHSMKAAGAHGYLLKNATLAEISTAIDRVTAGKEYWLGRENIRESVLEHNYPMITRREVEVLKLIASGLTNQEIAESLFIGVSTVDSHRKNLISKLQVKNTASLIRVAIELKII